MSKAFCVCVEIIYLWVLEKWISHSQKYMVETGYHINPVKCAEGIDYMKGSIILSLKWSHQSHQNMSNKMDIRIVYW